MAQLQTQIMEQCYTDLKLMVYHITHKISHQFRIPFEDLISESHCIFVKSIQTFDPKKGASLSSWLYARLQWRLISFLRKELKHRNLESLDVEEIRAKVEEVHRTEIVPGRPNPTEELTPKGKRLVRIVLGEDPKFRMHCKIVNPRGSRNLLQLASEHLEVSGWSPEKVGKAFKEVKESLKPNSKKTSGVAANEVLLIQKANTTKDEIWLLSRIGLTPKQVRELTK